MPSLLFEKVDITVLWFVARYYPLSIRNAVKVTIIHSSAHSNLLYFVYTTQMLRETETLVKSLASSVNTIDEKRYQKIDAKLISNLNWLHITKKPCIHRKCRQTPSSELDYSCKCFISSQTTLSLTRVTKHIFFQVTGSGDLRSCGGKTLSLIWARDWAKPHGFDRIPMIINGSTKSNAKEFHGLFMDWPGYNRTTIGKIFDSTRNKQMFVPTGFKAAVFHYSRQIK